MTQLHGVHARGAAGSLAAGVSAASAGSSGFGLGGVAGSQVRQRGGSSLGGRIVSGGLGGIGLRFDLVLRAPNMLVLVVVMPMVL